MDKISIIIPIYNVEKYLRKCINSIIDQTYKSFEIILIDDGSLDGCPAICDEYAKKDKRIKVIHKKNGGVSSARNSGISLASGKFITFIDADDLIEKDTVELLYRSIIDSKCDISTCALLKFKEGQQFVVDNSANSTHIMKSYEAIEDILYQKNIINGPVAKLYKKNLFDTVKFQEGISIAEDLDINYRLFLKAKNIAVNSSQKYYYLQRQGSAIRSPFNHKRMDGLLIAKNIYTDTKLNHGPLINSAIDRLFMEAIYIAITIPYCNMNHKNDSRECVKIIKRFSNKVLFDNESKLKHRYYALVASVSVGLLIMRFKLKRLICIK